MADNGAMRTIVEKELSFLELPSELLQSIFGYLCYDEISRCRLVCKSVDRACQKSLNAGFTRVERFHAQCLARIKSQLPRRESERRNHELSRHADILTSIETRLSLLSMTYGKYMDGSISCFIPGKVLDETMRILRIVSITPPGNLTHRPHELLQELRDISSMAMEHFEEHIIPLLRDRIKISSSSANNSAAASLSTSALVLYAAAASSGSRPLLNTTGVSTVSKNGASSCRIVRASSSSVCCDGLRKQVQTQRTELTVYKRELSLQRATQLRMRGKMFELERRLNEHEQRFIDILAQLRNGGLAVTTTSSSSQPAVGGVVDEEIATTTTTKLTRRVISCKRGVENDEGPSLIMAASLAVAPREPKRQKMNDTD